MNYPNYFQGYNTPFQNGPQMPQNPFSPPMGTGIPQSSFRLVASEEEARNAQIPFDGTRSVFGDFEHGRIYAKSFDLRNGTFPFEVYERVMPKEESVPVQYVPYEDYKKTIEALIDEIEKLKNRKAAKKNDADE